MHYVLLDKSGVVFLADSEPESTVLLLTNCEFRTVKYWDRNFEAVTTKLSRNFREDDELFRTDDTAKGGLTQFQ